MKPLTRIIIVLIGAVIICSLAYIPVQKGSAIYFSNNYKRLNEIFEDSTAYDMLFVGSSRTAFVIYPKIIDSICGVNSYNAGIMGGKTADFEMVLRGYLTNHPAPKIVVLNLDLLTFSKRKEFWQPTEYYPFLNNKAVVYTLGKYGNYPNIIRLFPFLTMTNLDDYDKENDLRLLEGKGDTAIPTPDLEYKGFISVLRGNNLNRARITRRLDIFDESIATLYDMIDLCRNNKIKLIFTYAPEYNFKVQKITTNSDTILNIMTMTAKKYNIPFLRDDSLMLCKDSTIFWDIWHLNKKGAMEYSAVLAREIKTIITKNAAKDN